MAKVMSIDKLSELEKRFTKCFLTPTTFSVSAASKHKEKFSNFVLRNIETNACPDLELILCFLIKHAHADCVVHFDFQKLWGESDEVRQLNEQLENLETGLSKLNDLLKEILLFCREPTFMS